MENVFDPLYLRNYSYQKHINVDESWSQGLDGDGVKIAVIDTGSRATSQDVDILRSYGEPDTHGHGTIVTNIIAAKHNSYKQAGIAPGAEIITINASDGDGKFDQLDLAQAIRIAIDEQVDIINISVVGNSGLNVEFWESLNDAMDAGIEIVAAVGNSFDLWIGWPAIINGVHGVGAVDHNGVRADFSQIGTPLDIYAPGVDVPTVGINDVTINNSGTSLAAPIVTGAMALMIQRGKDPSDIYKFMLAVENSTVGMLNIGFATHIGPEPLLHHVVGSEKLTISYLIPPQGNVYNVDIYAIKDTQIFDLNGQGGFVLRDQPVHAFTDLSFGVELVGHLFGERGVYNAINIDTIAKGQYDLTIEINGMVATEVIVL